MFSKYDDGIKLNTSQWFSVTPEKIARYTAVMCSQMFRKGRRVGVVDGFGGAAGNTIQFSRIGIPVYYVEKDLNTVPLARNNANVYKVGPDAESHHPIAGPILFSHGDFFKLTRQNIVEHFSDYGCSDIVIFLSPPWGGPKYKSYSKFRLDLGGPNSIFSIIKHARTLGTSICLFLPRNSDLEQIASLAQDDEKILVDFMCLHGRCKGICVYLGASQKALKKIRQQTKGAIETSMLQWKDEEEQM